MPRSLWIPLGLTVACAGAPQLEEAPPQLTPAPTRFTYVSGTAQYTYTSQRTIDQEVAGQSTRTEVALRLLMSTTIDESSSSRRIQFRIDSILEVAGPGTTQESQRAVAGLTITATLQPTGRITDFTETTEHSSLMATVTSAMKQFLPLIPSDGPEPGTSWVDTTVIAIDDGATRITKRSIAHSTAGDWSGDSGTLAISWRSEYTLEGEGQQMGQRFSLSGGGVTQGEHMLAADGIYLSTNSRDSSSADVSLPAFGVTVPIVQTGVDSVRIVR